MIEFVGGGWSSGPVRAALSFMARLEGIRRAPAGGGVLIVGRSVHGFGLSFPLTVVALDDGDAVLAVTTLHPGRVVTIRGASAMLELPVGEDLPSMGVVLRRVPRVG